MNSRTTLTIGGVILVAALMAGCGGSGSSVPTSPTGTPGPATADVTITISAMNGSNSYSPNPATVKVGQTVAWRNADSLAHTATADGGAFNTGTIAPGATSSPITMNAAGSLPYHCAIHPSMTGTLAVTQ
jgi:plastocyanin